MITCEQDEADGQEFAVIVKWPQMQGNGTAKWRLKMRQAEQLRVIVTLFASNDTITVIQGEEKKDNYVSTNISPSNQSATSLFQPDW